MLIHVRTTLVLDDRLAQRAKREAARRGTTLSEIVNEALREAFSSSGRTAASPFRIPTFGGREAVQHEPEDFAAATLDDDRSSLAR